MDTDEPTPLPPTPAVISADVTPTARSKFTSIASWMNTLVILAILFGVSYVGAFSQRQQTFAKHGRMPTFIATFVYEWVLVGVVVLGTRKRGVRVRDLIGASWKAAKASASVTKFARDLGIAVAFLLGARLILALVSIAVGLASAQGIAEAKTRLTPLAPHNVPELTMFIVLSLTAGFCEELVFRGYLQRQFQSLTKNELAAVILQGIVFGVSHGYQGGSLMIVLSVFGIMFGALAVWVKSLRPGMLAHALNDAVSGIALYHIAR